MWIEKNSMTENIDVSVVHWCHMRMVIVSPKGLLNTFCYLLLDHLKHLIYPRLVLVNATIHAERIDQDNSFVAFP